MIGLTITLGPPMKIGTKPILIHDHPDMLGMGNGHHMTMYKNIDVHFTYCNVKDIVSLGQVEDGGKKAKTKDPPIVGE